MPLHNIWNKNSTPKFFIAYGLIVLFESIIFKILNKENSFFVHLKSVFIANLISSLAGSLVIYIFFNKGLDGHGYDVSYSVIFGIFFVCTIIAEYPILKLLYKNLNVSKLFTKVVSANIASYVMLFALQIAGLFYAIHAMENEAAKNRKSWTNEEILLSTNFEIIFSEPVDNNDKTELTLISRNKRQKMDAYNGKYVNEISGDYIYLKDSANESKGLITNWRKNKIIDEFDFTYRKSILSSKDFGLLIFSERAGLEGIPDTGGVRNMYGTSYNVKSFNKKFKKLEGLRNVRYDGIYSYNDSIIYTTHEKCLFDTFEAAKLYIVERCSKDPGNMIISQDASGRTSIISKDSNNSKLVNDEMYFLNNENYIEKFNLLTKKSRIVLKEKILDFKVSNNEKFLLVKTDNHQAFGQTSFLVLIDIEKDKRLILAEGQMLAFDILE